MKKKCTVCGNDFNCYKSTEHKHKYCSKVCKKFATHNTERCMECDSVYEVAKSRFNSKYLRYKHCSNRCYDIFKHREKEKMFMRMTYVCKNCGKVFQSRRYGKVYRFCSTRCSQSFMKGENSFAYNGGSTINSAGYICVRVGDKYLYEHRLIVQEEIGRKLKDNEVVHHIDGNKLNNSISNLKIMDKKEHDKYHKDLRNKS